MTAPLAASVQARGPRGPVRPGAGSSNAPSRDPDLVAQFLEDAAHFPGGHADGVIAAASEADVAVALRSRRSILPIGAQSSLTGGATPMGETLLTTSRLNQIEAIGDDWVRVQAGVTLVDLEAALADAGKYYPPVPTFMGAFVGGTVATNAAGAATFKYGTTRDWVRALTVVLPNGEVLDVERGAARASVEFEIAARDRTIRVPIPRYRMPNVPKCSAGYFASPDMDLIDLFIGSEGTLGVLTAVTLRVLPVRPAQCLAFVPFRNRRAALALVRRLRDAAQNIATTATSSLPPCPPWWRASEIPVSAIEHMDARCLALLREDGVDRLQGVTIREDTAIALLVTLELPPDIDAARAYDEIGRARDPGAPDTALVRFCRDLDRAGVLDEVEVAVPGDHARAAQLLAVREAVPAAVNARVGRAKQTIDSRMAKTAADMIVPFDRFEDLLTFYDDEFARRGLDAAVWGHISDGNVHPNVIPRSMADVESGKEAILAFGREVIRMGGSPLAEHGVGRNPIKQQLLRELYGEEGIEAMRRVKRAIDPEWKLAPGVLFERSPLG
jgi:D-lactate dehydrogenase (cytochrome)